jgi:hypothetical protein
LHYADFKFCYTCFSLAIQTTEDKTTHVFLECTKKYSGRLQLHCCHHKVNFMIDRTEMY